MVFWQPSIRILRDPLPHPRLAAASCLVRELLQERGMRLPVPSILVGLVLGLGIGCSSTLSPSGGSGGSGGGEAAGHASTGAGGETHAGRDAAGTPCGPLLCSEG